MNDVGRAYRPEAISANAWRHHGRLDKGVHLITKPFASNDLAAKVRDVLDESA